MSAIDTERAAQALAVLRSMFDLQARAVELEQQWVSAAEACLGVPTAEGRARLLPLGFNPPALGVASTMTPELRQQLEAIRKALHENLQGLEDTTAEARRALADLDRATGL